MKREKRVYVVSCDEEFDFRRAEEQHDYDLIKDIAEDLGTVYSLRGFQEAINDDQVDTNNSFILID